MDERMNSAFAGVGDLLIRTGKIAESPNLSYEMIIRLSELVKAIDKNLDTLIEMKNELTDFNIE